MVNISAFDNSVDKNHVESLYYKSLNIAKFADKYEHFDCLIPVVLSKKYQYFSKYG